MVLKDRSEGWIQRKFGEIVRRADEDRAAVLKTIMPLVTKLQSQIDQIAAVVSHLGNIVRSSGFTTSSFSWNGTGTWTGVATSIDVPAGARYVDAHYYVEAVFCANSSSGTAINTYVGCSAPDLGDGSASAPASAGPDVVIQSGQQQQRVRNYIFPRQDITGKSTLTFYAFGAADNTGTNDNNYLKVGVQAIFSF